MKKIIVLAMSVVFLWSCNNTAEKSTTHHEIKNHSEHHQDGNSEVIELNNGEKWVVNEEMKPFVITGENLVNDFISNQETEYNDLAKSLTEQNNDLIKSCTMKGKSHDELHKWLHPHLEIVKTLGDETDATKANEIVLQLQQSYQMYHQYFN